MKQIRLGLYSVLLLLVSVSCAPKEQDELKAVSFNIRYDNPDDVPNDWMSRKPLVVDFLHEQKPDLIGMQEVLAHQYEALQSELMDYASHGVGREDGKMKGEFCPVFYRKDKFTEIAEGHCWLSETPNVPGLGWDAACERTVVWVILRDISSQKEFLFMNTHFDHQGEVARRESSRFVLHLADSLAQGRPVVLTGDFNAEPSSEVIALVTDASNSSAMKDSRALASEAEGADWTFHDFGQRTIAERPLIDYIFIRGGVIPKHHAICHKTEKEGNIYLSDHQPVLLDFILE